MTDKHPKSRDTAPVSGTVSGAVPAESVLKTDRAAAIDHSGKPDRVAPERVAKVIARAGLGSRREVESWIAEGRVSINGKVLASPAVTVGRHDEVSVDGKPLPERDRTRLWLFHKDRGLVTTTQDPEGRPTVFDALPKEMPRVVSIGRLDINTEGLLLLTNDGGLARILELPGTGWLRRYRVRAHGVIDQPTLDRLADGVVVDGVIYGAVEATLDRQQGDNVWITMGLREGKNREIKTILGHLGLEVNRLIRVSFGPFQLGEIRPGDLYEISGKDLRSQLGPRLAELAGADFSRPPKLKKEAPLPEPVRPAGPAGPARGQKRERPERPGDDLRKPVRKLNPKGRVFRDGDAEPVSARQFNQPTPKKDDKPKVRRGEPRRNHVWAADVPAPAGVRKGRVARAAGGDVAIVVTGRTKAPSSRPPSSRSPSSQSSPGLAAPGRPKGPPRGPQRGPQKGPKGRSPGNRGSRG